MSAREQEWRRPSAPTRLSEDARLLDLRMRARYHRDRHRLHVERPSVRPTSPQKLEEMWLSRETAEDELRRAEEQQANRGTGRSASL